MENISFFLNEKPEVNEQADMSFAVINEFMLQPTTMPDVASVVAELEFFYKTTYSAKKLNQVLTYYGIQKSKRKMTKDEMIQVLLFFEMDSANHERVQQRLRLWQNFEELKNDPYFSKYILDIC